MPGPEQLIRAAVTLPITVARRAVGIAAGILPGFGGEEPAADERRAASAEQRAASDEHRGVPADLAAAVAADDALTREREPVEEAAPAVPRTDPPVVPGTEVPGTDAPLGAWHRSDEAELVAESADVEATDPPGPEFHVEEPWDGYRRMKVADIKARLDGQPPEVLAAVEMYETTHRKRRGVLEAVRAAARA